MMDDKIIFKPEKGTASYNPIIDNIKDTNSVIDKKNQKVIHDPGGI